MFVFLKYLLPSQSPAAVAGSLPRVPTLGRVKYIKYGEVSPIHKNSFVDTGFKIDWKWTGLFVEGIQPGGRPSWFVYEDKNDHFNRVMDYSTTEKLKRFKTQRDDRTNKYQLSKEQIMFEETKLIDYLRIIRDELNQGSWNLE